MIISTLVVLWLSAAKPAVADVDRAPDLLRVKSRPGRISWISEAQAFDSTGRLRSDLVLDDAVRPNMAMNADGVCRHRMIESPPEIFERTDTLDDVATNARLTLSGKVVSLTRGFFHGFPGTLVGFRVTDSVALRPGAAAAPAPGNLRYTFIGTAEFITSEGAICSQTGLPVPLPQLGDSIMVVSYLLPPDEQGLVYPIQSPRHLVVERANKRVFTPMNLRQELFDVNVGEAMRRIRERSERAPQNRQ